MHSHPLLRVIKNLTVAKKNNVSGIENVGSVVCEYNDFVLAP